MDFTLALTHFCEKHGPKSVLCTQVLPIECTTCKPRPSRRERHFSTDSPTTPTSPATDQEQSSPTRLRRTNTDCVPPPSLSKAADVRGETHIEAHPYFQPNEEQKARPKFKYSQQHVEICASCSFSVPSQVAAKLPEGAPGSLGKDGTRDPTSAPVLRSQEFVCFGGNKSKRRDKPEPSSSQESQDTGRSYASTSSHTNCHDHILTYITAKSPYNAEVFSTLRNSVLRALSGEQLPHGMSEGPFCFGDATSGYTIAYSFRLTDPKARGRVRRYAFVALAGNDAYRAFKACPMLWEAFAIMAKIIEQTAKKYQDEQEQAQQRERDEQLAQEAKNGYTNVSSFLTQRPRDSDGHLRRVGQTVPMTLAEIIGNDTIFTVIHGYFVHALRRLGDKFGGLPMTDGRPMVYQTTINEDDGGVGEDMLAKMAIGEKSKEPATSSEVAAGEENAKAKPDKRKAGASR